MVQGCVFSRREFETAPFVRRIVVPNAHLVSPTHRVESGVNESGGMFLYYVDDAPPDDREVTDEEFGALYTAAITAPRPTAT